MKYLMGILVILILSGCMHINDEYVDKYGNIIREHCTVRSFILFDDINCKKEVIGRAYL